MKKVTRIVLVMALAAVFVVAGCQKQETATTETSATTETASAADTVATTETTATTVAESTGVAECDSYLAALEKYMNCQNVPQAARDAQKQAADQMRTGWASWAGLPEDARKVAQDAAKTSCSTALTTLKQAATASGCPVE
jgi:Ni/Co efflux regulator RcnB